MEKSTLELLEQMKNSTDYMKYREYNKDSLAGGHMKLDRALEAMLVKKQLKKSDVIKASGIEQHYAYQIFSGAKTPTSDKVFMLCIGLGLSVDEAQDLLRVTGYPCLYARNERDNVLLYGLTNHLDIIRINFILSDLGLPILE